MTKIMIMMINYLNPIPFTSILFVFNNVASTVSSQAATSTRDCTNVC